MIETKDVILRQGSVNDWQDLYRNLWRQAEVFQYMFNKPSPNEDAGRSPTLPLAPTFMAGVMASRSSGPC